MKSISRFTVCRLEPLSHFPNKKIYYIMPQLDIVSYFPQFFWFCIFFTSFYITLVQHYLPKLTRIFAVRQDYQQTPQSQQADQEFQNLAQTTHTVFSQSIQQTREQCTNHFQQTQKFLDIKTDGFNTHTNQAFQKYQTKKILLNQTVKNTIHQLQGVLPITSSSPQKKDLGKTNQLFQQYLVGKLLSQKVK